METSKNRYELIIGFVTLIISFSAFKEELSSIPIDIGFFKFNLSDYLLFIVYGFGLCVYLYIIERISQQTKKIGSLKIISYIEKTAFIIFVFLVLTPIILVIVFISYKLFDSLGKIEDSKKSIITSIITSVLGVFAGALSNIISSKYFKTKMKSHQEEIEKDEIIEFENVMKLFESKFYSQSIIEAFKVLEIHLIKLLAKKQISIPKHQFSFNDLFGYAVKLELINASDKAAINEIRKMRNSAAHLETKHTKVEAAKTIKFIKYLITKTSNDDKINNR